MTEERLHTMYCASQNGLPCDCRHSDQAMIQQEPEPAKSTGTLHGMADTARQAYGDVQRRIGEAMAGGQAMEFTLVGFLQQQHDRVQREIEAADDHFKTKLDQAERAKADLEALQDQKQKLIAGIKLLQQLPDNPDMP